MTYFKLEPSYSFKLKSMPRNGKLKETITNVCTVPRTTVVVDYNANCLICGCDGWLPIPVGKVLDFETIDDVWNSPIAKHIQKDIDEKKYTWCAVDHCGIKLHDIVPISYSLQINIDDSCNLSCPSCRREQIMHVDGPDVEYKQRSLDRILAWLENFNHPIHITLSGNGDPLASHIIRPFLKKYKPTVNQSFTLQTNGLLIKKQLLNFPILESIKLFSISIDAACAETYKDIRRGGDWNVLMENFEFIKSINKNHLTVLNFCVQKKNYKEIAQFIDLCKSFGFRPNVHHLDDWGTWNSKDVIVPDSWTQQHGTFVNHNVLDEKNSEYMSCQNYIHELLTKNKDNKNFFSNRLLELLKLA